MVYNGGSTTYGCTVRFVDRIFEYSFVLGIFDSLGFTIFVLALIHKPHVMSKVSPTHS